MKTTGGIENKEQTKRMRLENLRKPVQTARKELDNLRTRTRDFESKEETAPKEQKKEQTVRKRLEN